jgi:hypothetical protein
LAAANQLYEQNGRRDLPTLDSVRKLSRTNMADVSAVMKEWRRLQTASAQTAVVAVPDRVQHAASSAVTALWAEVGKYSELNAKYRLGQMKGDSDQPGTGAVR